MQDPKDNQGKKGEKKEVEMKDMCITKKIG